MPGRADPGAPRAALVLAVVIAFLPTRPAKDLEVTELSGEMPTDMESLDEGATAPSTFASMTTETFTANVNSSLFTDEDTDTGELEFILMVLIPSILLAILLLSVVLLVIYHKRKRNKQEPSSQGSQSALQTHELGSENVKVPIFEEDTPSVMEIEMEELDKWMNSMHRNADYECLPTLEEEKEPNQNNPSDNES
ncbi:transmembrane protein 154 [Hippopotamus amphibius kiboko]|uniref:transmembrane protein 154 n=1 Tax=Hippopotamus amphibius kiboko TaxID=575201 RepID=UPI00259A9DF0|nr:transmembrane protein 154 [Hippopotamus amphibius kiboko]